MERIIRRFLMSWLLLLGSVLLTQHLGYSQLAYWLLVLVAASLPLVIVALLARMGLGLREAWQRVQVLRRANKWMRWRQPDDGWLHNNNRPR